ncbi:putative acetyltransferase [Dysgonomonas sp. PH5-45]|uniref:GNAT family N-acetyltransferase n=1 Tax=unclassified Dysgonomonas TaxID=2630389 RepID=UPI0024754256|nr:MULTISPECIES: GNAT family N-acetyltransferase [unclassified Dysgonomonas]MDH6355203.1 putative acetyltransferase [Dysgonomonas sp. PH5-45]MDH6388071.1 putative acetyltransferase [Dysgonomonas sp. PH5-37]
MICKVQENDYPRLQQIWENAVRNTHDFLEPNDFEYYKSQLPVYFKHVDLYAYKDESGEARGFLGISVDRIEMLFVEDSLRGTGIGKTLVQFAVSDLGACKVDVNEQNKQAVGFYLHLGFKTMGRSEFDGDGRHYPLLHMERNV